MTALYDMIGDGYRTHRRPDPRIQQAILRALDDSSHVLNVGAGAGSYEPTDRPVVAVEPSWTMIGQRPEESAPVAQALATALPFRNNAFDASLAVLTIHHWSDWRRGVQELVRTTRRRVVILTWGPAPTGFWLVDEYFPEIPEHDRTIFPSIEDLSSELGHAAVSSVPIPHDCTDGFLGAYWRRPDAYLQPSVRAAISAFAQLQSPEAGVERLRRDLASGDWHRRHASLLATDQLDVGYRLVVAELSRFPVSKP